MWASAEKRQLRRNGWSRLSEWANGFPIARRRLALSGPTFDAAPHEETLAMSNPEEAIRAMLDRHELHQPLPTHSIFRSNWFLNTYVLSKKILINIKSTTDKYFFRD